MHLHEALATHKELYLFQCGEYSVIFKPLLWQEYKNFEYLFKSYPNIRVDLEDLIWEIGVLEHNYLTGVDQIDTGIVSTVAQLILYYSGCSFTSKNNLDKANQLLAESRLKTTTPEGQIKLAICEAFPSYRPEELDKMAWSEVMERLAFSEFLLKKNFEFNIKKGEIEDDSSKVFQMLNDFSANKGDGTLQQETTENDSGKGKRPRTNDKRWR